MAHKRESIEVTYRGRRGLIHTCLTPEQAGELRARWPDGVVELEKLGTTPLLTSEAARSWFVRAACTVLKIEDWRSVDRECTGRESYSRPVDKRVGLMRGAAVEALSMGVVEGAAKRARPTVQEPRGRVARAEQARQRVRRS